MDTPRTFAPKCLSHSDNHVPLKPVLPVTRTRLSLYMFNSVFSLIKDKISSLRKIIRTFLGHKST